MRGWWPERECLTEEWKIEWADERIKNRDFPKGAEDATEKGIEQGNNLQEHRGIDQSGTRTKTGSSDSIQGSGKE